MSILEIRQERDTPGGIELVAPQGEIDISNVEVLDQVLGEVIAEQPGRVLVDLSRVGYIDSAGISSLLRAGQRLSQKGGELSLVGGNPFVLRLIRLTGLEHIFPHYETVPAAMGTGTASTVETAVPAPDRTYPELQPR
jgi:anti-sigma B factor antagonist